MSDALKLQAVEVKNEVKRIKKLPKQEREKQMDALHDRIKIEIDDYFDKLGTITLEEQNSEYLRIYRCITAHKLKWELDLTYYLSSKRKEWNKTAENKKLQAEDVENEVERIMGLPEEEQEGQMNALFNRIRIEIDNYYYLLDTMTTSEQSSEISRISKCISAHSKREALLLEYLDAKKSEWSKSAESKKGTNQNVRHYINKVNTAHVSGLPLPEQAEVNIWWQDDKLIFASAATEFSLPVERVMGMGTTREWTAATYAGRKVYLTIEYKKEDVTKYIVVCVDWLAEFNHLIKYFDEIKGTREMNKQEL